MQAVVVSGLETYPSQARVIIQSAIQVPYKVRKRVIESVRRDFPGFVYLLKPVSGREVTVQREKLLLTGNNEKYASILRHVLGDGIMSGLPRMNREVE